MNRHGVADERAQLLAHCLEGTGTELNIDRVDWADHIQRDTTLRTDLWPVIRDEALRIATENPNSRASGVTHRRIHADMSPGEALTGYNLLGGSNERAGDTRVVMRWRTEPTKPNCPRVEFDVEYTFNDVVDPNPYFFTDSIKSALAEIGTLGRAKGYTVRISWQADIIVQFSRVQGQATDGDISKVVGYPFNPPPATFGGLDNPLKVPFGAGGPSAK